MTAVGSARRARWRYGLDLVVHLVEREFRLRYRRAFLGWIWAVAQPLARLLVLSFVFTRVLPLGIDNYPVFLFTGLIAWGWFSSGVASVTSCVLDRRDLLFRPGLPRVVIPVVSALTDGLDYLAALPVLALFLVLGNGIPLTAVLLPVVLGVELLLILGVGFILCSAHVHLRDVRLMTEVSLLLGFYVTPVFYDLQSVPQPYRSLLELNPLTHLLEAHRALLVDGRLPDWSALGVVTLGAALLFASGLLLYRKMSPSFLDEL
ncbi:MAG: ABC transporter permease [Actinomycetota bacterium]|nr:ABC transporter permease [Actinomycetota bacterium]